MRIVLRPPALTELLDWAYVTGSRCGCDVTLLTLGCMQILHTHIVMWIKEMSITSPLPCEFDATEVSLKHWYLITLSPEPHFTEHIHTSSKVHFNIIFLSVVALQQKFHALPIRLKFTQIYGPKVQYCRYEMWWWTQFFFQHSCVLTYYTFWCLLLSAECNQSNWNLASVIMSIKE